MPSEQLQVGAPDVLAAEIVRHIVQAARSAIEARDRFTLAIPGGSVANLCIPPLIVADIAWEKTHVFWVDERAVPTTDINSNAGQAFLLWKGTHFAAAANVHAMFENGTDIQTAVRTYGDTLASIAGTPITLDVVLLGVGEDGHIASLFPGRASATQSTEPAIAVADSPKPPADRMSLSFNVLANAREVIVAAFGEGKAEAMQQALEDPSSQTPVARIIRESKHAQVLLDAGAASLLQTR